jgi:hypothetical protein
MSTQELDNRDTLILERFECKYGGKLAEYVNEEYDAEPPIEAHCDADNVVSIMHDSVQKLGPLGMKDIQSDVEVWGTIKTDEGKELLELNSGDATTYVATEYADMVCDLFEVDIDTFIENTQMNGSYGEWPILYNDPDTDLVVMVAPFMYK